jgi:hypothetical protein
MSKQDSEELTGKIVERSAEEWGPTLLRRPPKGRAPRFTGPEAFWPPDVKDVTNLRKIPWDSPPGELTESLEIQVRETALKDERVREALGERYVHIATSVIDPGKEARHNCFTTCVTLFSYAHNQAVQVTMKGLSVDGVSKKDGYQPPEGVDEVRMAIDIARGDSRLRDKVLHLNGKGILVYPRAGSLGAGHRVLKVTFTHPGGYHPVCLAIVDLNDKRVLSLGSLEDK